MRRMRFPYRSHIVIRERYGSHIGMLPEKFRGWSGGQPSGKKTEKGVDQEVNPPDFSSLPYTNCNKNGGIGGNLSLLDIFALTKFWLIDCLPSKEILGGL